MPMASNGPVTVKVPATVANLGPGFDCLGLALNIYDTVTVARGHGLTIDIGEGRPGVSTGMDNLVYRAISKVFAEAGEPVPGLKIEWHNGIPLGRGLGSSAASI